MSNEEAKEQENKNAVASLRAAQANMSKALDRISSLENSLDEAARNLDLASSYISDEAFAYKTDERLRDKVKGFAQRARRIL